MATSVFGLGAGACRGPSGTGDTAAGPSGRGRLVAAPSSTPGFVSIAPSFEDAVRVPDGYSATVLARWGDPIGHARGTPAFDTGAANGPEDQLLQFGMHHDGMGFFPLPEGETSSLAGVIAVNHEYVDRGLLHPAVPAFAFTPAQVEKEINAHGVTIYEVAFGDGGWQVVRPSKYARRITADTPCRVSGPAKGHALMKTAFDPGGEVVLGTFNNCANGMTPWGTFLTCEEHFNYYFTDEGDEAAREGPDEASAHDRQRYGITKKGAVYRWARAGGVHARFDAGLHPNEVNRFGWVVEIDPYDPDAAPVKRTALGRLKHENAAVTLAADNRVVVYMGDDERFEYLYKFVSRNAYTPGIHDANINLLDAGTLYVARFDAGGSGTWLPLTPANPALAAFADRGEIAIRARAAADAAGATPMDRPEWIAVHPVTKHVYCALTNNAKRERADGPNPRINNLHGHILRWTESDPAATSFAWEVFLLAGGDFSSPDGLAFDADGRLWIQTDMSTIVMYHPTHAPQNGAFQSFGTNQILVVDPADGRVKRFLTGPIGCEITGLAFTPDGRTLFVNVQHPGEPLSERAEFNDPREPTKYSRWPDGGRPRSATVVIRKNDGGPIGS